MTNSKIGQVGQLCLAVMFLLFSGPSFWQVALGADHFQYLELYLRSEVKNRDDLGENLAKVHEYMRSKEKELQDLMQIQADNFLSDNQEPDFVEPPTPAPNRGIFSSLLDCFRAPKVDAKKSVESQVNHLLCKRNRLIRMAWLQSSIIAARHLDRLRDIPESDACTLESVRFIESAYKAIESERRPHSMDNRIVDMIVARFKAAISIPECRLFMEVRKKLIKLGSRKREQVAEVVQEVCDGYAPFTEKLEQKKPLTSLSVENLYDTFLSPEKLSLDKFWSQSTVKGALKAVTSFIELAGKDQGDKVGQLNQWDWRSMVVERIEAKLIEPCENYVRQLEPQFQEAGQVNLSPNSEKSPRKDKKIYNQFFLAWTQFRVCKLLIEVGAKRILEDAENVTQVASSSS